MALIAMCCYDTEENQRTEYTIRTLECLLDTVDHRKHRIIVVDNASCKATRHHLALMRHIKVITLPQNIGTAKGINEAWKLRTDGEHAIKMDNDVVIHHAGWVDALQLAIETDPTIGIVGLKRKDLEERPDHSTEWYRSLLYFLPHERGQRWIPFEETSHVMGTCQMYSSALLEKMGFLIQPSVYGFDDSLASLRARIAGFKVGFLPHIDIDHIDRGDNSYTQQKHQIASEGMEEYSRMANDMISGKMGIYYDGK